MSKTQTLFNNFDAFEDAEMRLAGSCRIMTGRKYAITPIAQYVCKVEKPLFTIPNLISKMAVYFAGGIRGYGINELRNDNNDNLNRHLIRQPMGYNRLIGSEPISQVYRSVSNTALHVQADKGDSDELFESDDSADLP
jgi:hypothetical protein